MKDLKMMFSEDLCYHISKKILREVILMAGDVLTVSSKGQVVLPATLRKKMDITAGTKLASYQVDDMIILRPIE